MPLLGGDTVSGGPPQALGLTAIGRATHRPVPSRGGAQPGDALWLTGAARRGDARLRGAARRHRRPTAPPIAARWRGSPKAQALAPLVTAMMDVSDGLLLDAWRLAEASEVSLAIDSAAVPIAAPEERRARRAALGRRLRAAVHRCPPASSRRSRRTRIGTVEPRGFAPLFLDGEPIANRDGLGYEHGLHIRAFMRVRRRRAAAARA